VRRPPSCHTGLVKRSSVLDSFRWWPARRPRDVDVHSPPEALTKSEPNSRRTPHFHAIPKTADGCGQRRCIFVAVARVDRRVERVERV
jgi:hypothetical protein